MCHLNNLKMSKGLLSVISSLGDKWSNKLIPAMCQLAKETNKPPPYSDLPNGKHVASCAVHVIMLVIVLSHFYTAFNVLHTAIFAMNIIEYAI